VTTLDDARGLAARALTALAQESHDAISSLQARHVRVEVQPVHTLHAQRDVVPNYVGNIRHGLLPAEFVRGHIPHHRRPPEEAAATNSHHSTV